MAHRRQLPLIILILAGLVLVALVPSASTRALWTDSTQLTQAPLTTVSTPDTLTVTATKRDLPPQTATDRHSTPSFTLTNDSKTAAATVSVKTLKLVSTSSKPDRLSQKTFVQLVTTADAGPRTCEALTQKLNTGTAAPGSYSVLTQTISAGLAEGSGYTFRPAPSVSLAAGETLAVCPLVKSGSSQPGTGTFPYTTYAGATMDMTVGYDYAYPGTSIDGSGSITSQFAVRVPPLDLPAANQCQRNSNWEYWNINYTWAQGEDPAGTTAVNRWELWYRTAGSNGQFNKLNTALNSDSGSVSGSARTIAIPTQIFRDHGSWDSLLGSRRSLELEVRGYMDGGRTITSRNRLTATMSFLLVSTGLDCSDNSRMMRMSSPPAEAPIEELSETPDPQPTAPSESLSVPAPVAPEPTAAPDPAPSATDEPQPDPELDDDRSPEVLP